MSADYYSKAVADAQFDPTPGCDRCDHCHDISDVYQSFPTCRDCTETVCAECSAPGTERESDGKVTVLCAVCEANR